MKSKYKASVDKELEEFYRELERKKRKTDFIVLLIIVFLIGITAGAMIMRFQYNLW